MESTIQLCISEWRRDIYHRNYEKVVTESSTIAMLFHRENDHKWIEALQGLNNTLEEMSGRLIMPHIKKYMMDFIELEIKTIKGEIGKKKLRNERQKTLDLLSKAYSS